MMPTTDNSTQPTVPIARDKHGAPLSLPRRQTGVIPVLHQFEGWMQRTGQFQRLVEHGSVYIKGTVFVRGRDDLAILASGAEGPKYTFQEPCPATPGRVEQLKSFAGGDVPRFPTTDEDPSGALSQIKISTAAVEEEDGKLARALYEMIDDKAWASELIIDAKRSRSKMLELLRAFANTADESDTATAQIAYNKHTQGGIQGALSRASFDAFYEQCESLQLALPAGARDGEMRLRVMIETVLLMASRPFYDLYAVAKIANNMTSQFADTLALVRRMLDEDAKKSALLAATEGTSGGMGVALPILPTVSSKDPPTQVGRGRRPRCWRSSEWLQVPPFQVGGRDGEVPLRRGPPLCQLRVPRGARTHASGTRLRVGAVTPSWGQRPLRSGQRRRSMPTRRLARRRRERRPRSSPLSTSPPRTRTSRRSNSRSTPAAT